ncbi:MAG: hypothetical protein JNM17_30265 [Archangium sp.]|nr:hypothetical protein [Archangium sp.]
MRFLAVITLLSASAHALPSVALDLTALDAESFAALDGVALEKSATVRLVQDGFAVVTRTANPDVIVRVEVRPEPRVLLLTSRGPGGDATREVPWGSEPLVELHLELVQKLAELTRAVAEAKPAVVAPVVEEPPVIIPPATPREREWRFLLFGGGLLREGGLDPLGLLSARWGTRFRVAVEAGLSGMIRTDLTVFESQLSAGGALAVRLPASLEFEVAALAGVLVHSFVITHRVLFESQGVRANLLLTLPLTLSWSPREFFSVGVRAALGWGQGREHVDGTFLYWTRGPIRFDFGVGVTFAL